MPIIFISLSDTYIQKIKKLGFEGKTIKIQVYICNLNKQTYYVSPANSLCFMDGGIDYALSRIIFPNIELQVKDIVKQLNIKNIISRSYLPIGSSVIINDNVNKKSLVIAPTMLLPQNVSTTKNAYYATMSILYNVLVNKKENLENVDIIFTSLCCGYGKMNEDDSINQILQGIKDYVNYNIFYPKLKIINQNIIINEPNLKQQPKFYQNTEFFEINPKDIINC